MILPTRSEWRKLWLLFFLMFMSHAIGYIMGAEIEGIIATIVKWGGAVLCGLLMAVIVIAWEGSYKENK